MTYKIECTACRLEDEAENVDSIFRLQEGHCSRFGEHHLLEFERVD